MILRVIEKIYQEFLNAGHEGVMLKNPGSFYSPENGERIGLKLKPNHGDT